MHIIECFLQFSVLQGFVILNGGFPGDSDGDIKYHLSYFNFANWYEFMQV